MPTPGTSEWRFSGASGAVLESAFGPGQLHYADGAGGATALADQFVVSDGALLPHIGGAAVSALHFQPRSSASEGYALFSGVETPLNAGHLRFSLVFDFLIPEGNGDSYLGLWNASATNANDSELFLRPDIEGWWASDPGTRDGSWTKGAWHRAVFVNDYDDSGAVALYLDGQPTPELEAAATDWVDDGTPVPFRLLGDDTPGETSEGYLANLAFVDRALAEAEVLALGAAQAQGIFPACGLELAITPTVAHPGDAVAFHTCGGEPGDFVMLFVSSVNGISSLNPLSGVGVFDAGTSWIFDVAQTPNIGPVDIGFTAYSFGFTSGLQATAEVELGLH